MGLLEDCLRQDLNESAPRRIAVLRPLKLIIDNFPEGQVEECTAPNHPQNPEWGSRPVALSRVLYIEQEDFMEVPTKGYFRLSPGMEVRLRYAYIVKYVGLVKNDNGEIEEIHCTYDPDTKSGTPGAESRKVKGNIHWLSSLHACKSEVRIFDRLFVEPHPDHSREILSAYLEPSLSDALPEELFQFERNGYFIADRVESKPGRPIFNRAVTLRDSWGKSS